MRQQTRFPILLVILGLAWPPIVQAQQSDAPMVKDYLAENLERLRDRSIQGDAVAQYLLAEKYRMGSAVERWGAVVLYKRSAVH